MHRRVSAFILIVLMIGIAGSCTKEEKADPAEVAFGELRTAWGEAETTEEKVALAENYLAEFPDTDHSGSMAGAIVYYRGHELDDPEGAWSALSAALDQIEDPEHRFKVSMEALSLSDSVEVPLDVSEVAAGLAAVRALDFNENVWVSETAIDVEEWTAADQYSSAAIDLATPENLRAAYPDREFTDEEVTRRVRRWKAQALTNNGWAAYNLGDSELASARFEAANEAGSVSYTGVPDTPLFRYWGRAELSEGDFDRAIELLGAEALFGEAGSLSEPYLREAYVAKNGNDSGFDEFLWTTRSELAKTVDDFELLDYEGNPTRLSSRAEGKVMLLAFWFPT